MVSRRCRQPPLPLGAKPLNLRNRKVASAFKCKWISSVEFRVHAGWRSTKEFTETCVRVFGLRDRLHKELTHNYSDQNERARRSQLIQKNAVMFWARNFRIRVREGGFWLRFPFQRGNWSFHRTTPDGLKGIFIYRKVHKNTKIRISSTCQSQWWDMNLSLKHYVTNFVQKTLNN